MRFRPPRLGFVYLVAMTALCVAFFVYLAKEPWWEKSGEERDLGQAAYLERLAAAGDTDRHRRWELDAFTIYARRRAWSDVRRVLKTLDSLDGTALTPVAPGLCWSMDFGPDRVAPQTGTGVLFLHNATGAEQVVTTRWSAARSGAGRVRPAGGAWASFDIEADEGGAFEQAVAPGSWVVLEFAPSDALREGGNPALRLEGVEVAP